MIVKNNIWQIVFIFLILLIVFWPILLGNKVFFGGDIVFYFYPIFSFLGKSIGNIIKLNFWLPSILSGFPVYTSLTGGFFYFLNIIFYQIFSFITAYHLITFLNFFATALLIYYFVRNLKLSKTASLIAALTYVLSQLIIGYQAIAPLTNIYFLLPLLFLSLIKISQRKYRYILVGGVGLGISWLSGHPQFIFFAIVASFFYAIFLDWKKFKVVKSLLAIGLFSIPIGLFQLLPSAKFASFSVRSLGLSYQQAKAGALTITDLISYLFPYFEIPYFGWGGQGQLYIGVLSLFFALLAVFYQFKAWKRKKKLNKTVLFFIFLYLFALLCAIPYSPLFFLMHFLPVFKYFRGPLRWMQVGIFALAILTAYGYGCFLKKPKISEKAIKIFSRLVYGLIGLVFVWNVFFWLFGNKIIYFLKKYFNKRLYRQTTQLPLTYYYDLIEEHIAVVFNNFNLTNYRFLIIFSFILLSYCLVKNYFQGKISKGKFKFLIILVISLNLLTNYWGRIQFISRQLYLREPETVKIIKSLEENPYRFRIFSFMPGFSEYHRLTAPHNPNNKDLFIFQSEMIAPNLNILYDIQSIDGYDNMMPRRNARVLAELGSDRATLGNKLSNREISLDEKIKEFLSHLNLLSMQNVKYIISAYRLDDERLNLIKEVQATSFEISIYIYENLEVLPRFYFAENTEFIGDDEIENFDLFLNPELDFGEVTLIECGQCKSYQKRTNNSAEITIEKYGEEIKLKTKTNQIQWLIFGESNLPKWQVYIDGELVNIYTANYLFQAIELPEGEHFVEFKYKGVLGLGQ